MVDRCGVCGGRDSSCRKVTGSFRNVTVPLGYHKILDIPAGATFINVTERRASPNYLGEAGHTLTESFDGSLAAAAGRPLDSNGKKYQSLCFFVQFERVSAICVPESDVTTRPKVVFQGRFAENLTRAQTKQGQRDKNRP